ncbi:hypothetical protein CERZMDRAFT_80378 [Cercospora zeae-maydis SCOH1-5]|uniref:Uncharacterized protein n=1 Tax=Cercospora zeae-maydis SCOH1-5 TaxID=717836 RepID=A0A6A6FWD4_9PEZI|nr:hypothetical protein CERZMDRAFT_80378 [Cercospora zeae-maydis SCOH1-5]
MAPKLQPPSSPTSLLWAHQIKREHGHLSERLSRLEAAISRLEAKATVEKDREAELAALSQQLQTYADENSKKNESAAEAAIQQVRQEVSESFEDIKGRLEAVLSKLDAVDREAEDAAAKKKEDFTREVDMLKRVKRIEEEIDEYRSSLTAIGKQLDEQCVQKVQAQVKKLLQETKDAGDDRQKVKKNLSMLEDALAALREENEKLVAEVQDAKAKMVETTSDSARSIDAACDRLLSAASVSSALSTEYQPSKAKPSKKALGKRKAASNADSDDEPTGTQSNKTAKLLSMLASLKNAQAQAEAEAAPSDPSTKAQLPSTADDDVSSNASNPVKRAFPGLDADESPRFKRRKLNETTEPKTGIFEKFTGEAGQPPKQGKTPPTPAPAPPKPAQAQGSQSNPRVVRKGPGWVVVEEPVGDDEARGPATASHLAPSADRPAPRRRKIEQNDDNQARAVFGAGATTGKKRKAGTETIDLTMDLEAPRARRSRAPPKKA